jgi:hypothetical protein
MYLFLLYYTFQPGPDLKNKETPEELEIMGDKMSQCKFFLQDQASLLSSHFQPKVKS